MNDLEALPDYPPSRELQQAYAEKHIELTVLGWSLHRLSTETLHDFAVRIDKLLSKALDRAVETAESEFDQSLATTAIDNVRRLIEDIIANRPET